MVSAEISLAFIRSRQCKRAAHTNSALTYVSIIFLWGSSQSQAFSSPLHCTILVGKKKKKVRKEAQEIRVFAFIFIFALLHPFSNPLLLKGTSFPASSGGTDCQGRRTDERGCLESKGNEQGPLLWFVCLPHQSWSSSFGAPRAFIPTRVKRLLMGLQQGMMHCKLSVSRLERAWVCLPPALTSLWSHRAF